MAHHTPIIVITGGPNGGKSKILEYLKRHFERLGYQVVIVTEVATDLIEEGRGPAVVGLEEFQRFVLAESIKREEAAKEELKHALKPLIFVDRGIMDGAAYVDREFIQQVWTEFGYNIIELRDERYAGVIHLVTTAIGKPDLYLKTCGANPARYETTVELAVATDERTRDAWIGTPHFAYIDNSTDFDGKIARAITWAEYFVSGKEHERKFLLLTPFDERLLPAHRQRVHIRQWYCESDEKFRIRMRGQDDIYAHTRTKKQYLGGMSNDEDESALTPREFAHLQHAAAIPGLSDVDKDRWCFVENGIYFELDVFRAVKLVMMESEVPVPEWAVILPSWGEWREVTGDSRYTNRAIAEMITRQKNAA